MSLTKKKEKLIQEEWKNFSAVSNEGGKASCQNDPETFFIMRRCQFSMWSEELVDSWYSDLKNAENIGRNLLSEKYGWMMQRTAPKQFEKIEKFLPVIPDEDILLIDEIVKTEVLWMEEYSRKYPFLAGGNRPVHASEDSVFVTSFETYLWGELHTYSPKTLRLYHSMINNLLKENKNMAVIIMEEMVKQYGYKDIDHAEYQYKIRANM